MNRRYFPLFAGLLVLTALLSGGCASTGGKKQASRRELIAILRSLEPLQSEGRIPRATVLAAFGLHGEPYSRGNGEDIGGQLLRLETWTFSSGIALTGAEHFPRTLRHDRLTKAFVEAFSAKEEFPDWLMAELSVDDRVPEYYDTFELRDLKGRVFSNLKLDYGRYRPSFYKSSL